MDAIQSASEVLLVRLVGYYSLARVERAQTRLSRRTKKYMHAELELTPIQGNKAETFAKVWSI